MTWHELTVEDLAEDSAIREEIEKTLEAWAPNYITDSGRVSGYNDWIERVEGLELPDGTKADLGDEYDSPVWKKLKSICKTIARESA